MKKRLLIHAGVHQTGNPLIKAFLANRTKALEACGVIFPSYGTAAVPASQSQQRMVWDIHSRKVDAGALRDWAGSLAQGGADTVILHSEDFCRLLDLSFLDAFVGQFDVEVVFYIRRQDEWVNSWYNLNVKWPFDAKLCQCTPITFLDHLDEFYWIRYCDTVERWSGRLGRERVHVRVLEQGQVENPVADFCELAGIKVNPAPAADAIAAHEHRLNASLSPTQLELLRRLGTIGYSSEVRTKISNAARRANASTFTNVYAREIRQLIVTRYARQNQKLASQHLGRSDGELFRDKGFPEDPADAANGMGEDILYTFIRKLINEFNPGIGDN